MTKITRSTLRIPEELLDGLKEIAQRKGQTLNGLIRDILWDWLERERRQNDDHHQATARS